MQENAENINRDAASVSSLSPEQAGRDPERDSGSEQDESLSEIENSRTARSRVPALSPPLVIARKAFRLWGVPTAEFAFIFCTSL